MTRTCRRVDLIYDDWYESFQSLDSEIRKASSIVISGHRNPDQDSVGSQIALYHILKDNFPDKEVVSIVTPEVESVLIDRESDREFFYLGSSGVRHIDEISNDKEFDLFIGLDCSTYDRLPDGVQDIAENCNRRIFIDHHPIEVEESDCIVISDSEEPSTTSLLHDIFLDVLFYRYVIPGEAYNAMYLGLVGDTGNFSNSGTTTETLFSAVDMSENMTVDPFEITTKYYRQKSFDELRSSADVIINARRELNDRFIYYVHGSPNDSIAEGFSSTNNPVDMLTKVRGYQIAMTAVAIDDDKFRVSIRSSGRYVINDVAAKYQGGGHEFASGCTCSDSELDDLIAELRNKVKLDTK